MDHTLEDGTAGLEDKLLQIHNVNNFISKGKFPGPRLDERNVLELLHELKSLVEETKMSISSTTFSMAAWLVQWRKSLVHHSAVGVSLNMSLSSLDRRVQPHMTTRASSHACPGMLRETSAELLGQS